MELLGFVYHWGLEVNGITVIGEAPFAMFLTINLIPNAFGR